MIDRAVRIERADRLDDARRERGPVEPAVRTSSVDSASPACPADTSCASASGRCRRRACRRRRRRSPPARRPVAVEQLPADAPADRALVLEVVPRHRLADDHDRRRRGDVGRLEGRGPPSAACRPSRSSQLLTMRVTVSGADATASGSAPSIRNSGGCGNDPPAAPPRPSRRTARDASALDAIEHVLRELQPPVRGLAA